MVHKYSPEVSNQVYSKERLPWSEGSYCSICEHWVNQATYDPINFGLATIKSPDQGPVRYYDVNGKRVGVFIILPVKELAHRDIDGTFLQTITEFVKAIYCGVCGHVCRGRPHEKRNRKKAKRKVLVTLKKDEWGQPKPESKRVKWVKPADKQTAKQQNTIPDSVKIKQFEDEIKRLKTQAEYENDPSLWRDDIIKTNIGTVSSIVRPEAEKTLEDVERERNKLYNKTKTKTKVMKRLTNNNETKTKKG